ncbi:hypothetical protein KKG72_06285 [bacterium]|nr:hypothetical protein [bacterium]MBU1993934.1 hypothetical protein [bacterium]
MKNTLTKVLLTTLLAGSAWSAEISDYKFDTYSLLGFEGGYNTFDVERNAPPAAARITKYNFGHAGIKIGAQSENYRLFLSARYYDAQDFDYATTLGAELQYMFNFSSMMNFYLGVNTGIANMRFIDGGTTSRTISDPYVGGDAGFNIHLGEMADLELGARVMSIQAENVISNVTYKFDTIVSGYASIIFKYKMD